MTSRRSRWPRVRPPRQQSETAGRDDGIPTANARNQPTGGPDSLAGDDGWVLGAEESTDVSATANAEEVIDRTDT